MALGRRHATPSAILVVVACSIIRPAANESAYAGASADTTPTISVVSPNASRAAIIPLMPLPRPNTS